MTPAEQARTVYFKGQGTYSHGSCMCTTACLQFAMAVLCKRINLLLTDEDSENILRGRLDHVVMALASRSHAQLEQKMSSRMVSVHEIINECGIDLQKLTIELEELFIVSSSSSSSSQSAAASCEMVPSPAGHPMKYRATSCFLQDLQHLTQSMETQPDSLLSAAIATSNGHTVCLVYCGEENGFAFFDPLPGTLCMGLSSDGIVYRLCEALHLRLLQVDSGVDAQQQQQQVVQYRKGRKIPAVQQHHQPEGQSKEEMRSSSTMDLINSTAKRLKTSLQQQQESQQDRNHQQCDISLLYRKLPKKA